MNSTSSALRSFDSHSSLRFMTDTSASPCVLCDLVSWPSLSPRRQKHSYIFISNAILGRLPCFQRSLQAPTHSSIGLCSTSWLLLQVFSVGMLTVMEIFHACLVIPLWFTTASNKPAIFHNVDCCLWANQLFIN